MDADRHPQHSGLGSREQPLQMTHRAQELFLAYAHYCGERGVEPLIPIVKQAVTDAVSNIELTTKLGADQVLQMFSDAHKGERPLRVVLRQICSFVVTIVDYVLFALLLSTHKYIYTYGQDPWVFTACKHPNIMS